MPRPPYAIISTSSHRRPRYGLFVLAALVLAAAGVTAAWVLRPAGVLRQVEVAQPVATPADRAASVALTLRSASVCITCGSVETVAGVSDGKGYKVQVRMDDGSLRSFTSATQPEPGASVRVQGDDFRVVGGG